MNTGCQQTGDTDVPDKFVQGSVSTTFGRSSPGVKRGYPFSFSAAAALPCPYLGYKIQVTWKGFTVGGSRNREQLRWLTVALLGKCWPQDLERERAYKKGRRKGKYQSSNLLLPH